MKITNKKIASKKSSSAWLIRQAKDPYVTRANKEGFRARAVYKLVEINEKFRFLKDGQTVVDLGAAPGSWSQYIAREFPKSRVIAMDLLEIKPINGVEFYQGDFTTDEALQWLRDTIGYSPEPPPGRAIKAPSAPPLEGGESSTGVSEPNNCAPDFWHDSPPSRGGALAPLCAAGRGSVDVVLSDMAPNTTGHQKTDHLRQMVLLEYAWDFAKQVLKPGGTFVAKSFTGGTTDEILREIKASFERVVHIKPPSSRKDSVEMFIVGLKFKESENVQL